MKRKLNENDIPEASNNDHGKDSAQQKLAFGDLGLDARLLQAVSREKFSIPTPVQAKAIPLALSGKDVLSKLLDLLYCNRNKFQLLISYQLEQRRDLVKHWHMLSHCYKLSSMPNRLRPHAPILLHWC